MDEKKANRYPGNDPVGARRRELLSPESKFKRLREISDNDLVLLLGHRNPGEEYGSAHPPLDELEQKDDPIADLIEPSAGARAGDRIKYLQMTDSVYYSPSAPTFRGRMYHVRYPGIDTIVYSGRQLMETRERDLELYTRELMETELFDAARTSMRAITVHGSSLRLDENGLMFDARRRTRYDPETGEVSYVKNQMAIPMDRAVNLGKPMDEEELISISVRYGGASIPYRDAKELWKLTGKILEQHVVGGFNPTKIERR
ncbi:MAG: methyl coenzyme M reductase subunit gamma [Candidatus Syntrophoarchaeum caldarius]|uniref:coenzyme-B sulfoethylthiotransferase n=1 Tax=Candidatus Syntropharchaeum caldarium TaxID=1838285 RepID=A0A1F2P8S5_9EURY|nr:MAG: methyl coenzyme M reductase subunit gamma [Candidatus Syntrophoarchaeum caldarius]